jgi:protease I
MTSLSGFAVAVIATDGFEQDELMLPVKALKEAKADVHIISLKKGDIQGYKHHDKSEKVWVDYVLADVKAADYDAVLLPGGALNADALRMESAAQEFVRDMDAAGKPIAFICHAPWLLVSAELVKGHKLTSYFTIQDDIRNAGGEWVDEEVVKEGHWVSSRQPKDIPAFNKAMLEIFTQAAEMENVAVAESIQ